MKRLLPLIVGAGLVATLPSTVNAQNASATVDASATILAFLDVTKLEDLDFGNVNAGSAATLTPGTTPGAGSLGVVKIDHNSEVSVAVSLPAGGLSLNGNPAAPKLPVSFSCGFSTGLSGALDGSVEACASLSNRNGNGDGTTRTSYLQVGGDIASGDTTDRIPGTYEGSLVFTVTAVY